MATLNPFKNCLSQSLIQNENIHGCRSGEISLPKIQVAVSCSKAYRFKKFREHLYCWVIDKPTDQQTNAKTEPPWREKINAESLNFVTIRSNIQRYPLVLGTCSKPPVYGWGSDPPPCLHCLFPGVFVAALRCLVHVESIFPQVCDQDIRDWSDLATILSVLV